ncbi:MAG: ABC transporter permease [Anaerolineaceae bacterium]|jgi:ATP-binding cassette subfamily B protein|nr:ABC transporter ATP-binding protein [Anaerolineae bacterium]MDL1927056.1 ABC transporter ATP-binding protein [Anaerolineae bacterium AMX1]OQY82129.1 MAG: ABC transporter [Anaerolineae bacterium UTCFX3]WKZ55847.1 MAG: ABC transporter ATP-binding protein [Anaerolineales bacterium]GIK11122.1 MAG: ABC transporter permease [Chloroflexota bacterium]GJQ39846.1 MAG: ABC transporter permease [Anaerolineaceae bacterium]
MKTQPASFDLRQSLAAKSKLAGIWRMMTDYRLPYLGATLALAVSAASRTLTFLLLRYFADDVLVQRVYIFDTLNRTLAMIALAFVGLACFEGFFSYASGRLAAYTAEGITRRLRDYLFDHIQRLTFSYHSQTPTGDLIERVTSDVDSVRRFFSEQAIGVGRILIVFAINFAALLDLNSKLAWLSIVTIPVVLAVSLWFFKIVTKRYEEYQEQEAILSTTLQENLTGVRVVKAFARQGYEMDKFEKDNFEKYARGKRLTKMHALFWPLSDIVLGFQMLFGFVYGANLAIHGEITIGTYLAYTGLITQLLWPIRNLGRIIVQASSGLVSYSRLMDIVRQDREALFDGRVQPQSAAARGDIVFDNVSFMYSDGKSDVLKDVSFHVKPGQAVALLGSTGSGKTSLVNLLPRFHEYTGGSILLDGAELRDYPRAYLRRQIGIVEQEPFLFSRSIRENITYGVGRDVSQEEIERAARAAAIHDVILTFPDGYNTLVGEKGVTLSGGQKQRVTIARTLLKNPRILILDDSTSSVDPETEAEIRAALQALMQDRTTFIIAHRIQSVMDADLILVLDRGAVVQTGTHEELLTEPAGMYRRIYDIQTRIDEELELEIMKSEL